jgi:hypothetical protein
VPGHSHVKFGLFGDMHFCLKNERITSRRKRNICYYVKITHTHKKKNPKNSCNTNLLTYFHVLNKSEFPPGNKYAFIAALLKHKYW